MFGDCSSNCPTNGVPNTPSKSNLTFTVTSVSFLFLSAEPSLPTANKSPKSLYNPMVVTYGLKLEPVANPFKDVLFIS